MRAGGQGGRRPRRGASSTRESPLTRPASPLPQALIATLNAGTIASANEVVIAPSQVHISAFQGALRKDIGIASQVRGGASRHPPRRARRGTASRRARTLGARLAWEASLKTAAARLSPAGGGCARLPGAAWRLACGLDRPVAARRSRPDGARVAAVVPTTRP